MELILLGTLTILSVLVNALMYKKYTSKSSELADANERIKDLDMIISALQEQVLRYNSKPTVKTATSRKRKPAKKEVAKAKAEPVKPVEVAKTKTVTRKKRTV